MAFAFLNLDCETHGTKMDTKSVVMFPIYSEFIEALDFCLSYGLSVNDLPLFGCNCLVFFDPVESLIFVGWANDRFLMFYYWF